ncbi:MAG: hypothetical protein CR982_02935 [Candidatus Cloacimonadota bacterium]|nr:MAG: hypothetical protein CR982_02935 [Candidatus Cloacimonadota bacterium]PIE82021.1 MAG: hypothetical protein CSA15_00125 [Candidatus Delongbacteria bacterium]
MKFLTILILILTTKLLPLDIKLSKICSKDILSINSKGLLNGIVFDDDKFYIPDGDKNCICVTDLEFNKLATIGRKGSGPGEFQNLTSIVVDDKNIFGLDYKKRELSIFDKNSYKYKYSLETGNDRVFEIFRIGDNIINRSLKIDYKTGLFGGTVKKIIFAKNRKIEYKEIYSKYSNQKLRNGTSFPFFLSVNSNKAIINLKSDNNFHFSIIDSSLNILDIKKRYKRKSITKIDRDLQKRGAFGKNKYKPAYYEVYNLENSLIAVNISEDRKPSNKDKFLVDLYKFDKYLGRLEFKFMDSINEYDSSKNIYFVDKYLIILDKESSIADIYTYEIVE